MNGHNITRRWIAYGKKFNGNKIDDDSEIQISEAPTTLSPKGADHFGIPIDINVAVQLISNLWQAVKPEEYKTGKDKQYSTEKYNVDDFLVGLDEKNYKKKITDLVKAANEATYWMDELLQNSFCITFEKGGLLKTLSQSGCEGIRFYLCLREEEKHRACKQHGVLSLVTVGVDKNNKDLGYSYTKDEHKQVKRHALENKSLCDEYGFLPSSLKLKCDDVPDNFVLFKYALPTNQAK